MPEQEVELAKAREALGAGRLKRAIRHAWRAGVAAARRADAEALEEVIDLASAVRDAAEGRLRKDADEVATFCTASLANARAGIRPQSPLAALFSRPLPAATKTCPDCAERVKDAAKVCRFCGYRFDAH
jgi:hypothetical protein